MKKEIKRRGMCLHEVGECSDCSTIAEVLTPQDQERVEWAGTLCGDCIAKLHQAMADM